jgi:hypothetical protein
VAIRQEIPHNQKCKSEQQGQWSPNQESNIPISLCSLVIGIVGLESSKLYLPHHQPNGNQNHQDEHSDPSDDPDEWYEANQKENPHPDRHVSVETRVAIRSVSLILSFGGGGGFGGIDRSRTITAPVHAGVYEFVALWTGEATKLFGDHGFLLCKFRRDVLCELGGFA